jgi:thioredoxin 2
MTDQRDPSRSNPATADGGAPTPGDRPAASAAGAGPISVLVCADCGQKNKIRPSERGAPHCGSCSKPLAWVVNATDATFPYEARASVAVLVDLWAPWCGPCRVVGPMLEALAREYAGRMKVVKVNVDENPMLAQQFGASSIPTMIVIKGDRIVDRIVGAVPATDLKMRLFPYLMRT